MAETTGEGIRPTRSEEIRPDVSVVEWLKDAERKESTERFNSRTRSWREVKGVDSIKRASMRAVDKVGELLRHHGVVDEMVKLGVRVDLGNFSVSARQEDDQEKINFWKEIGRGRSVVIPPVITVKVGPEEFSQRGVFETNVYPRELEKMLNKSESRKDVWAAVGGLGNLTPRDIARAFRKSIQDGQDLIRKQQKLEKKEELSALRRGK